MTARDDLARPLASADAHRRARRREQARRRTARQRQGVAAVALMAAAAAGALALANAGGGSSANRPGARDRVAARNRLGAHRQAHGSVAAASGNVHSAARTGAGGVGGAPADTAVKSKVARTPVQVPVRARPAAPSPGSLPQTHAYPSAASPQFRRQMRWLWEGIVHDSRTRAIGAFFPRDAYVRLKAIGAAGADWSERLVGDYGLDIGAAHALLGRDAPRARLIAVHVSSDYGHWVEPGVCYNSVGYYEMPNARVVYREDGQTRSFGIASMISWRGVWYVVHLGAVLRSGAEGVVDEPASGPGVSAESGTC